MLSGLHLPSQELFLLHFAVCITGTESCRSMHPCDLVGMGVD